jgi:hypothetical protein
MTCRHTKGDPNCSSSPEGQARALAESRNYYESRMKEREQELLSRTPDPDQYEITKFVRVDEHVVLMVKYPSCSACAYEGNKVLVLLNVNEQELVQWRRIDPHFRDPKEKRKPREAPSPAARFPASEEGWKDALDYAKRKAGK